MTNSSDIGAIKLGLRLGDERFYRYIRAFGLGQATGIELPGEERGLTRPPERWTKSSVGAISMGQELGATAIQMALATNVIASGGLWHRPRIVRQMFHQGQPSSLTLESTVQASGQTKTRPFVESRRVLSPETALQVRRMLEQVVLSGTGKAAHLKGYTSAGKTGTAQKYDPNTGTYSRTDYVASFIGFAPVSNPVITIAVILDSAVGLHQGGQISAPLFKRVAEQVLAYLEVPPEFAVGKEPAPRIDPAQVSDFAPQSEFETQKPAPASVAQEGKAEATAVVDLEGARTAPDFLGKTARAVAEQALVQGLEVELVGSGVAREQVPPPGGRLLPGRKIAVKFAR
jgi:cell division protein FtsI (penicillin-binding protein 3)